MSTYGKIEGAVLDALEGVFGDRLSLNHKVRAKHGADFSRHTPIAPDAVAFAKSEDEAGAPVQMMQAIKRAIDPQNLMNAARCSR